MEVQATTAQLAVSLDNEAAVRNSSGQDHHQGICEDSEDIEEFADCTHGQS
jgi:hypothetical protein